MLRRIPLKLSDVLSCAAVEAIANFVRYANSSKISVLLFSGFRSEPYQADDDQVTESGMIVIAAPVGQWLMERLQNSPGNPVSRVGVKIFIDPGNR